MTEKELQRLEELEAMDKRSKAFKEVKEEYEELKERSTSLEKPKKVTPVPVEEPVKEDEAPAPVGPQLKKLEGFRVLTETPKELHGRHYMDVMVENGNTYLLPVDEYMLKLRHAQ